MQKSAVGTTSDYGFIIDDVAVTNSTEFVNAKTTPLAGAATSFSLNSATAGAALAAGTSYYLRVRPNVGTRWFGYGPTRIVTARLPSAYETWGAAQSPALTGGPTADHDGDGLANAVEYAFGLNPTVSTPAAALPQPAILGDTYCVTFSQPTSVTGVTYGAQWSRDLTGWSPLPDSGVGSSHKFSVSSLGEGQIYFRYQITVNP